MDDTHCKRIIKRNDGQEIVDEHYPVHLLNLDHPDVFAGFKKGTLKKATFEFQTGATITFEETGEKKW